MRQYQRCATRSVSTQPNAIDALEQRMLLAVSMDAAGWTVVTPSGDTRAIYVSSTEGNDANTGTSPLKPVRTLSKAISLLRNGKPDWLLLKRGDAWNEGLGPWKKSGRSADQPMLVSSYGASTVRPRLNTPGSTGMVLTDPVSYLDIIGLSFVPQTADRKLPTTGIKWLAGTDGFLIEDCSFESYGLGIAVQRALKRPLSNVAIRRSQIVDSWEAQGIFMDRVDGILIEENLLDHNGWNPAVGTSPTIFNHNIYLTSSTSQVSVRGNILANASSHGLQARSGGQIVNNLFINNPIGMSFGFFNGSGPVTVGGVSGNIRGNVFLGDRDINGRIRGWAIEIGNTKPGGNTLVEDNIVAHSTQRAFPAIQFNYGSNIRNEDQLVGINDLVVSRNIIYDWFGGFDFRSTLAPGGKGIAALNGLTIRDNQIQAMNPGPSINHASPYDLRCETWANNQYHNAYDPARWFKLQKAPASFAQWQKSVEPTAGDKQIPYPDPNRSVASHNALRGGPAATEAFLRAARAQSHLTWNPAYTAQSVINYIREGFELPSAASTVDPNALLRSTTLDASPDLRRTPAEAATQPLRSAAPPAQ